MSALRAASVGVLAAFVFLATQCDFGIDTKGLAGDGQAPIDATPAEAGDAVAPPVEAAADAPAADAIDETSIPDAPAEAADDASAGD